MNKLTTSISNKEKLEILKRLEGALKKNQALQKTKK